MLACCNGDGLQPVKDINLDLSGLTAAKDDGEFSRFFKTAYLFDFAQEYKIKHLEDKLKRELEFQAKVRTWSDVLVSLWLTNFVQGKYPLRVEEIYDMGNYFWQPNRDDTAINLMIDSIARGYVKNDIRDKRKNMYEEELAIWKSESKQHCDCPGDAICFHDDLPEMVARRVKYFEKPENAEELNEEFGKKTVEEAPAGDAGGWDGGEGWAVPSVFETGDGTGKLDETDKENQAPGDWADDANDAAQGSDGYAPAAAPASGW